MKISIIIALSVVLTGCTIRFNSDGSRDFTLDAPKAIRFAEILLEK